jgi:gamma-glutamylcyclotransferase (GGCT)/AIG2-like uncharacterized protein YtfP
MTGADRPALFGAGAVAYTASVTERGKTTERLFSYGTLQQENVQLATFGRLLKGTPDAILGFRVEMVEIRDPQVVAASGKDRHPGVVRSGNPTDRVPGTVFEITPTELASADAYEVYEYERVEAELASGSRAWVYVLKGKR